MKPPNFFIVGAAKCGTTALYHFLREHPAVFMPYSKTDFWRHKEPHHFSPDLDIAPWVSAPERDAYLALFAEADGAVRVGEASAWYLFSKEAPHRIHEFAPDAKIIIMLRNPVDWMRSWHHDCLRWGHEDIASFPAALRAEPDRREGRRIPRACGYRGCLQYRAAARFSEQLQRYQEVFPPHQIKVLLQEQLRVAPAEAYRDVTEFLDIADIHKESFESHNRSDLLPYTHRIESRLSRAFTRSASRRAVRDALIAATPGSLKRTYRKLVNRLPPLSDNTLSPDLRAELQAEFRDEIERLSHLLNRDLSHWSGADRT